MQSECGCLLKRNSRRVGDAVKGRWVMDLEVLLSSVHAREHTQKRNPCVKVRMANKAA